MMALEMAATPDTVVAQLVAAPAAVVAGLDLATEAAAVEEAAWVMVAVETNYLTARRLVAVAVLG